MFIGFAGLLVSAGTLIAAMGNSPIAACGAFIGAGLFGIAEAIKTRK